MSAYASNPALLRTHYQQVAAHAARNLATAFKEEVGSDEEEDEKEDEDEDEEAKPAVVTAAATPGLRAAN